MPIQGSRDAWTAFMRLKRADYAFNDYVMLLVLKRGNKMAD